MTIPGRICPSCGGTGRLPDLEPISIPAIPLTRFVAEVIDQRLISDSDLDSFGLDYYPTLKKQWTAGMDRRQKVNLLLTHAKVEDVLVLLVREDRAKVRRFATTIFSTDDDLTMLLDHWPDVRRRISEGMSTVRKMNLLMEHVQPGALILGCFQIAPEASLSAVGVLR